MFGGGVVRVFSTAPVGTDGRTVGVPLVVVVVVVVVVVAVVALVVRLLFGGTLTEKISVQKIVLITIYNVG